MAANPATTIANATTNSAMFMNASTRKPGQDTRAWMSFCNLGAMAPSLSRLEVAHHPSNFPTRWPCRVSEGGVVGWERLEDGDGRDRDDGGRDWGRLGHALAAAEQEAARRFSSPCGDRLGRA